MFMNFRGIILLFFLITTRNVVAQIGITNNAPNNDPNHLINNILIGGGVTVSNIQFSGNNQQIGYFSNGNSIGMSSGIVMSSGHAIDADLGGNPSSNNTPNTGIQCNNIPNTICNDLHTVVNSVPPLVGQSFSVSSINDLCVLEFDFIPESDTIIFNYSFGSEEYLNWVNSSYNDVFGFFISGPGITGPYSSPPGFPNGSQNIAIVPNTNPQIPITISSIHPGYNGNYYNSGNTTVSYNGYTDVFTAIAIVQPCQTYHIRLDIADGSDDFLDSGVFLEANSFTTTSVSIDTNAVSIISDTLFVECIDSSLYLEAGISNSNYSVLWNTGDTSTSIFVGPGQYFYTANNGSCSLSSDTVTIFNQTIIQKNISVNQISCFGQVDGSIDLSVTGGTPPYNFFWIDSVSGYNSNNEDLINLSEGNYHCIITDSNLCPTSPISVTIVEPSALEDSSIFNNVSCFGLNDGYISLFLSGGVQPYTVSWSSLSGYTDTGEIISNLYPDVYTATITDANNWGPINEVISIIEPPEITLFGVVNNISCFGLNDGSINLVTNNSNLSYNWIGPNGFVSNIKDISNLEPGSYSVSIIDSIGCLGPSANFIITEPSDIFVSHLINDVSCFGLNDGSINLTITGGVGNYTTIWNSPNGYFNISEDAVSLISGFYNYSIIDANGCSPTVNNSPVLVNQPSEIQASAIVSNETCYGDEDGSIDVTILPNSIYTYDWIGPNSYSSSTLDISNLAAGNYNLVITDSNSCQIQITETVNIGNIILLDTFINHISCNGSSDGNIVILAQNSTSPTFLWSGPNGFTSTNSQIFNLSAGNYSVIVNDSSNCPTQLNISISEPSFLELNAIIINESCEGYLDGEIEVSVFGGTPNYTYIWSNGSNNSINSNLLNGDYILNVIDENNCIISDTFNVSLYLFDTTRLITNVTCFGGSDGSVDLEVNGGNPPFIYNWSNGSSTQDLTNLSSAVYTVNITDSTNCTISRDIIITSPQQLAAVTNISPILCYGDSTGTVNLQINGGIPPYVLDWGITDTNSMWAGFHSYTVTDINNCMYTDSVEILQNDSMEISSSVIDIKCHGDFTGSIEVQISQGTGNPPYNYNWSGPNNFFSNSEDIYNLESGYYILTVTDNNNCTQQLQLFVDQPLQLNQITNINTSNYSGYHIRCQGENSGWIKLNISGGYGPHSYLWDNGNQTDSIFGLYSGVYSVEITDSLGCKENLSVNLYEPNSYVSADVVSTSDYNGYNISCFGNSDGSITVNPSQGISPYTFLWSTNQNVKSISNLYAGYYEVFVYDNNGCLAIDSITLVQPNELFFDLYYFTDTCSRGVGKAEFIATGGVPPYNAVWSNSSTDFSVDNLFEGEYFVEVSDENTCGKIDTFFIENIKGPTADFEAYPYSKRFFDQLNNPFYFVDLTISNMSNVKNWNWSFGDNNYAFDSVVSHSYNESGIYTVNLQIETEYNCIDTTSKKVIVDEYSFYIPNSLIPSSENKENSIFKGYGFGIKKYELKIFSRWGELVFQTNDLDIGWNGTYQNNDNLCPVGIYTYTVYIENIYGEIFEYRDQVKLIR